MLDIATFQSSLEMVLGGPLDAVQQRALATYFDKCETLSMADALRAVDPSWAATRQPWELAMVDGLINPSTAAWLAASGHVDPESLDIGGSRGSEIQG